MQVNISPDVESYLQSKILAGIYNNYSEAINDAVYYMLERDKKIADFLAAVKIGEEQINNGEGNPLTSELLEKITEEAFANFRNGKKVDSDVI